MTATSHGDEAIGTVVSRLVQDAKAYAEAEVAVVQATATARADAAKGGVVMLAIAFLLGMGAVGGLIVGLILSVMTLVGPLAATAIVIVGVLALAGILAKLGISGLQRAWRVG